LLGRPAGSLTEIAVAEIDQALDLMARAKVAGQFWGERPPLPSSPYILLRVGEKQTCSDMLKSLGGHLVIVSSDEMPSTSTHSAGCVIHVPAKCDPWHLVSGAVKVIADADDELLFVAALAEVPVQAIGAGRFSEVGDGGGGLRAAIHDHVLGRTAYTNPFTREAISLDEAIELCAFWKRVIDSNRPFVAALGIAAWKRTTAAALLWAGGDNDLFVSRAGKVRAGDQVVVWKSRTGSADLVDLKRRGATIVEAEDGFIRSIGLGADCVPPLSLVVDCLGIYFDPQRPSELENMLQHSTFSPELA
jgi:capsular polysaccharide export protein